MSLVLNFQLFLYVALFSFVPFVPSVSKEPAIVYTSELLRGEDGLSGLAQGPDLTSWYQKAETIKEVSDPTQGSKYVDSMWQEIRAVAADGGQ